MKNFELKEQSQFNFHDGSKIQLNFANWLKAKYLETLLFKTKREKNCNLFIITLCALIFCLFFVKSNTIAQTCDCTDYIYINDPSTAGPVHKFRIEADSTLTEIFSNTVTSTPFIPSGQVLLPHGLDLDQDGSLYVGNIDRGPTATRGIDKFGCEGTLTQANAIPNDEDPGNSNGPDGTALPNGPVGSQTNFFILDGIMYVNSWVIDGIDGPRVTAYSVCTGEQLGYFESCDPVTNAALVTGDHWGLYVEKSTHTAFYNTTQGIVVYDLTQPYGCQDSIIVKQGLSNINNRGITRLPDGTFITRDSNNLFELG